MESQELGEEDKAMVRNHPLYRKLWPLYKPSQKKVSFGVFLSYVSSKFDFDYWVYWDWIQLYFKYRLSHITDDPFSFYVMVLARTRGSSTMNGSQVVWNRLYIISRVSIWFGDLLHRSKTSEDEDGKDVDVLRRPDDGGAWPTAHWCIKAITVFLDKL